MQGVITMCKIERLEPRYNYKLRAKISESGFRTISGFSDTVGVNISRMSRVVSGWELPGLRLSKKMSKELGLSIEELGDLFE